MRKYLMAAAVALSVGPAHAASIINGSFETSTLGNIGNSTLLSSGSTAITGWTVSSGTVDYTGSLWNAANGSRSVDLAGTSAGAISQTLTGLITGRIYDVIFNLAANPDGNPNVKTVRVSSGTEASVFTANRATSSRTNMNWMERIFSFTAESASQLLTFRSLTPGNFGPVIDNVRLKLAPIPLPATAPLALAALAGLFLLRRTRRSSAI